MPGEPREVPDLRMPLLGLAAWAGGLAGRWWPWPVCLALLLGGLAGLLLTVAAAEAAIGLAILVIFFRRKGSIAVDDADRMHG